LGSQTTSGITAPTVEEQKTTGARNETTDLRDGNRQEVMNGDREKTERRTGGVANHQETSGGRQKRKYAGVHLKDPHHAMTVMEGADPSLITHE
jgi:hypothetical protein